MALPKSSGPTTDTYQYERHPEPARDRNSPTRTEADRAQTSMPPSVSNFFNRSKGPESPSLGRSHSRSRTRSLTQSMIARMQPTVADAPDDELSKTVGAPGSSATSLELKSANNSDLGEKLSQQTSAPPTAAQSFDQTGEPLKPSFSTPSMATASRPSPHQRPVDYQAQFAPAQSYSYPTPPGGYPSPPQRPIDTPTQSSHKAAGHHSPPRTVATPTQGVQYVAASPAISPPHSPRLTQQATVYSQPPIPYPYGYPPQVGHGPPVPNSYYPSADPHFMPSPPPTQQEFGRAITGEHPDEHQRDWHKVTSVLPELNRLLSHFEEQKGQSTKDSFARQLDSKRTQEMAKMRLELDANKQEYEKVIQKLVSESFRYKADIREKDEKLIKFQATVDELKGQQSDYQAVKAKHGDSTAQNDKLRKEHESLVSKHEKMAAELQATKKAHDALQKKHEEDSNDVRHYKNECANWKKKYQEAAAASDQARLAKEDLVSVKMRLEDNLEELRRKHHGREEKHQAEVKGVRKEYEAALEAKDKEKHDAVSEQRSLMGGLQVEFAALIDRHSRSKKDLEAARSTTANVEKKLEAAKKDHEAQTIQHRQVMEGMSRDMEAQTARHKQEMDTKSKALDEQAVSHRHQLESQLASLTSQRQRELETLRDEQAQALRRIHQDQEAETSRLAQEHAGELQKIHGELTTQREAFDRYKKDTEGLRAGHGELATTMIAWKQRQAEWQAEQDKLTKVLETLGLSSKSGQAHNA